VPLFCILLGLEVKRPVDLAPMPDSGDRDRASAVVHCVDHPVVARADAQVGPVAREGPRSWRAWIGGQDVDDPGNGLAGGRVKLP
jgi:hypothetical protein